MSGLIAHDAEHERELRASLDRAFAAGNLGIVNGFLCDVTGDEPEPLVDLVERETTVTLATDELNLSHSWPVKCGDCGEEGRAWGNDEGDARFRWMVWHRAVSPAHRTDGAPTL